MHNDSEKFPFPKVLRQASASKLPSQPTSPKSPHLRPDIHSSVSHLLNEDYTSSPTSQFIDDLLSRTYPGANNDTTLALNSMVDHSPGPSAYQINNPGPLSMFYKQPYSISPNNIYQSIVITQLNEEIRSKDDIDIQVINPNELHLIATAKSMPGSNEFKIRSKSAGNIALRFNKNGIEPVVSTINSVQCQTDAHIDPFAVKSVCNPTVAEMESLSFSYAIDENERLIRLNHMINDTIDDYERSKFEADPCIEFEHYLRGDGSGAPKYERLHKLRRNSSNKYTESTGTQTFYTSTPSLHKDHQYTQTTPGIERKKFNKQVETQTSTDSTPASTPEHQVIKTITKISIPKEGTTDKIKDSFSIKNSDKSGKDLQFNHSSEYISDIPQINTNDSTLITKQVDSKYKGRAVSNSRLSQSSIECTTVLGNRTTVTGITGALDSADRFTMSVDYPSNLTDIQSESDAETIGNESGDEVPQYTPPKIPSLPERVQHVLSPKQPITSVSKYPETMKPEQNNDKKPPMIPKNISDPPPLPQFLANNESDKKAAYPEEIYNINNINKRKPTIVECNDPSSLVTPSQVNTSLPVNDVKTQVTPKPVQERPMEKKWKENLIANIQNERPKLKPLEDKNKPPPANTLLNKPTNAEIKQSFIEKFIKPLEAADASSLVTVPRPNPKIIPQPRKQSQPVGTQVLPVGKTNSFKSRLHAGGFQSHEIPDKQALVQQNFKPSQQTITSVPNSPRGKSSVSRDSISSNSKFDLTDYGENLNIDLEDTNKITNLNNSKMSFNDTTSDIIDIDFEQYNEEVETPTEKEMEGADSDDSFNKNIRETLKDVSQASRLSLSKSDLFFAANKSDLVEVDFDSYDEQKTEPYIITELLNDDSTDKINAKNSRLTNSVNPLNRPLITSTSPSPLSPRVVLPQKPNQNTPYPTLNNLISSLNIDSGRIQNNPVVRVQKSGGTIQKLFTDWNNLLDDSGSEKVPVAASAGANTVTFGTVQNQQTRTPSNFKQNLRKQSNGATPTNQLNYNQQQNANQRLNNQQQLNKSNGSNVVKPGQQPRAQQQQQNYPSDRTFSSDTGIEADVDDDQYYRTKAPFPASDNQMSSEKIRQIQFQQKQRQPDNQLNTQRNPQQPQRTNPNLQGLQQQRRTDNGRQQPKDIGQAQADIKQQQRSKSSEYDQFAEYESTEDIAWEPTYGVADEIRLSSGKIYQNKFGDNRTGAAKDTGRQGEYASRQTQFTGERKSRSTSNKQRQRKVTSEKGEFTPGSKPQSNTKKQQPTKLANSEIKSDNDQQTATTTNEWHNEEETATNDRLLDSIKNFHNNKNINNNNNNNSSEENNSINNESFNDLDLQMPTMIERVKPDYTRNLNHQISPLDRKQQLVQKRPQRLSIDKDQTTVDTDSSVSYMGLPEKLTMQSLIKQNQHHSTHTSNESLNESSLTQVTTVDNKNSLLTTEQHLAKIVRLMNVTAQREFDKMLRRIERRKVRVPEILELLKTAKSRQAKKLEDELRILMRKSERDNFMLQQAMLAAADSARIEAAARAEANRTNSNKPLMKIKKLANKQAREISADLESSSQTSFKNASIREVIVKPIDQANAVSGEKRRTAKESGYSSNDLEESTNELKSYRVMNPSIKKIEEIETKHVGEFSRKALYKPLSRDSHLDEISLMDTSLYRPIEPSVGKAQIYGRRHAGGDQSGNRSATGSGQNSINNSNSRNQAAGGPSLRGNRKDNNGNGGGEGDDSEQLPPDQGNEQIADIDSFRVEYINEDELGENYRDNYQVECDQVTGEFYILDFENRIKFIIVKDKLGHNLGNFENAGTNIVDEVARPYRGQEQVVPSEGGFQADFAYVEEKDLADLDMTNVEMYESQQTGEKIMFNRDHPLVQWVVLGDDWRDSQFGNYIAEEDMDLASVEVNKDETTGRRFIIDTETGDRYYLVRATDLSDEFKKKWLYLGQLSQGNRKGSAQSNDSINEIDVDYIDEEQVNAIDLGDGQIIEDPATGEAVLYHPSRPNTRWIVLPSDWQTAENSPYVDENDMDMLAWDVLTDEITGRQYVIDDNSGQQFFIVNPDKIKQSDFMEKWQRIVTASAGKVASSGRPLVKFEPGTRRNEFEDDLSNDGYIKNLDKEPSNLQMRTTAKFSPDRVITQNSRGNSKNLYSTVNGSRVLDSDRRPGILINSGQNSASSMNRITGNKRVTLGDIDIPRSRSAQADKSSASELKKTQLQQSILRNQQEAARKAFLNRKMPGMGPLWLHQQLLDENRRRMELRKRINASLDYRRRRLNEDNVRNDKHWKSLTHLTDPTVGDGNALDKAKLAELQMYGYNRLDKKFAKKYEDEKKSREFNFDEMWKRAASAECSGSNNGFGGGQNTFVRGVLTENFRRHNDYVPVQMNSMMRALVPKERLTLKQQYLLTPRYLKDDWLKALSKSNKLQPRIILINDNERILTANKNCNVYIQYLHSNDGVIGADPMYQFMLPDCGPTNPARPLLITPRHLRAVSRKQPNPPAHMALREAPVFVYHQDGSQFYENIAQYLAGRQAKLSPKTVRKIMQFQDMAEFEEYLNAKLTREEAKKISELSGNNLVNVDTMKYNSNSQHSIITGEEREPQPDDKYYYFGDEYDPLRNEDNLSMNSVDLSVDGEETREIEINNQIIKSTFVGYNPKGEVEQLSYKDLPEEMVRALQQATPKANKFLGLDHAIKNLQNRNKLSALIPRA